VIFVGRLFDLLFVRDLSLVIDIVQAEEIPDLMIKLIDLAIQ